MRPRVHLRSVVDVLHAEFDARLPGSRLSRLAWIDAVARTLPLSSLNNRSAVSGVRSGLEAKKR